MSILPIELGNNYRLREMSVEEFRDAYHSKQQEYFTASLIIDVTSHLSCEEQTLAQNRQSAFPTVWRMQWALEHNGEVVGWTYSYQHDHETLYMCNTAIAQEHRSKGLYKQVLQHVLSKAKAEGFQLVTSKHYASNNAIIVPKLKAGFIITGMSLDEKYGLMVHLTKYLYPQRESIAVHRIGETR
ncbi:MAG: GNAT family N-acetyltransferase [Ignavibacteria bacterium]|jgi:predicted GNAT family acetyltransferase